MTSGVGRHTIWLGSMPLIERQRRPGVQAFAVRRSSETSGEKQDDQDQHEQSDSATRVIPPVAAIRPRRNGSDQKHDENDQQDQAHGHPSLQRSTLAIDEQAPYR